MSYGNWKIVREIWAQVLKANHGIVPQSQIVLFLQILAKCVSSQVIHQVWLFFAVVDCQLSAWSEWSSCDRSCGKGVQSRTRVIVQHPSPGKPPCDALEQKRACMGTRCSLIDRKYKSPIRGWYKDLERNLIYFTKLL